MADMSETFVRAAKGDPEAQAAILDHAVMTAFQPGGLCPEYLAAIELWARLLAAHGRPEHQRRLAGVLLFKGSINRLGGHLDLAELPVAEGTRLLRDLADSGDEHAASQLAELSRRLDNNQTLPAEIMLGELAPTSH